METAGRAGGRLGIREGTVDAIRPGRFVRVAVPDSGVLAVERPEARVLRADGLLSSAERVVAETVRARRGRRPGGREGSVRERAGRSEGGGDRLARGVG